MKAVYLPLGGYVFDVYRLLASASPEGFVVREREKNRGFYGIYNGPRSPVGTESRTGRTTFENASNDENLIFITADNFTGKQFEKQLAAAYKSDSPPTLNEVSWWQLVPLFRDEYNQVIYLPLAQAKYANIIASIRYMEQQKLKYDLVILSHGLPNHLTNGDPGYFMSFKEIDELKGQLKKLNLVFMQACFGQSLAKDWIEAGAAKVMAFEGFNRNFFFVSIFLDHHRWYSDEDAFKTANRDMKSELTKKKLYNYLINQGLGMDVDQYLDQAEEPILTTKASLPKEAPVPADTSPVASSALSPIVVN